MGNQWLNSSILPEACPLSAPCESREELRVGNVALFLLEANWKSGTVTLHLWFIDKAEWMTCIINEWLWVAVPKRNKTKSGKIKYLAKKSNRSYCKSHLNGPYFPKHSFECFLGLKTYKQLFPISVNFPYKCVIFWSYWYYIFVWQTQLHTVVGLTSHLRHCPTCSRTPHQWKPGAWNRPA